MTQNASKTNATAETVLGRPVLQRLARMLASGTCAFALAIPLTSEAAWADWQYNEQYYSGGSSWTLRKVNPAFGGINHMRPGSTPGNDCPVPAFEVLNPKRGELRCVGYVTPW